MLHPHGNINFLVCMGEILVIQPRINNLLPRFLNSSGTSSKTGSNSFDFFNGISPCGLSSSACVLCRQTNSKIRESSQPLHSSKVPPLQVRQQLWSLSLPSLHQCQLLCLLSDPGPAQPALAPFPLRPPRSTLWELCCGKMLLGDNNMNNNGSNIYQLSQPL